MTEVEDIMDGKEIVIMLYKTHTSQELELCEQQLICWHSYRVQILIATAVVRIHVPQN